MCDEPFESDEQAALAAVDAVDALCRDLSLPVRLAELGVTQEMAETLAAASMGSSMKKESGGNIASGMHNIDSSDHIIVPALHIFYQGSGMQWKY